MVREVIPELKCEGRDHPWRHLWKVLRGPTAGQWALPSQQSGLGGWGEGSRDEAAVLQAKARTSHLCSLEEKARQANGERRREEALPTVPETVSTADQFYCNGENTPDPKSRASEKSGSAFFREE